ncbi:Imm30 family immunity protein [Tepidibacter sp. Z1-5]|uniref:Imm30 family immunity protein n=1 Tax=Tepidibacter sp. Z1-5 TaxID=3134138 RepID=UPI0030C5714B
MFGIIHLIESFDKEKYLVELINSLPEMLETAKEWAIILNKRILNSETYRSEYSKIRVNTDYKIKMVVVDLLNDIKLDNPKRFENIVNRLLSKL